MFGKCPVKNTCCFVSDLSKTKYATTVSAILLVAMTMLSYFAILGAIPAPEAKTVF